MADPRAAAGGRTAAQRVADAEAESATFEAVLAGIAAQLAVLSKRAVDAGGSRGGWARDGRGKGKGMGKGKGKGKQAVADVALKPAAKPAAPSGPPVLCTSCGAAFPSKTKMFKHLKSGESIACTLQV